MVRFQKMNDSKIWGIRSHSWKDFLGTKVRLSKSLNNDGSVAKVCESLVGLTGGVPKICFGLADVAGRKFFIVPVVPHGAEVFECTSQNILNRPGAKRSHPCQAASWHTSQKIACPTRTAPFCRSGTGEHTPHTATAAGVVIDFWPLVAVLCA